jgi:hypothetical protein
MKHTQHLNTLTKEFFDEVTRLHGKEVKPAKMTEYQVYFAKYNPEVVLAIMRLSPSWKKFLNHFSRSFKVEVKF